MSSILEGVKNLQQGSNSLDSILKSVDPATTALFADYLNNSSDTATAKERNDIKTSLTTGTLSPLEKQVAAKHVREFSDRLRLAEDAISLISQRNLEGVLTNSLPQVGEGELSFYLKGMAVRDPENIKNLKKNLVQVETAFHGQGKMEHVQSLKSSIET